MYYRRLCQTVNDKGKLIPDDVYPLDYIEDTNIDCYLSVYKYNEEQAKLFEDKGTIAGIEDVLTDKLIFDFDNEENPTLAKESCIKLVERLIKQDVDSENILITFSGCKGFGVEIEIDKLLTPEEHRSIASELASDLPSFDPLVYNASRILRIIGTRHKKTGLYKKPLTQGQLNQLDIETIKKECSTMNFIPQSINPGVQELPESIYNLRQVKKTPSVTPHKDLSKMDFSNKPKFISNCKFSLQNGYFENGERSTALLCLASTYKNMGYDKDIVYRMLKGVAQLQADRHNTDRFPEDEIWNNIIKQVFGSTWNNGQYSCRKEGNFLYDYCQSLKENKCNHQIEDDLKPKSLIDIQESFKHYVNNIDKNKVLTGIEELDRHVFISAGANVGLVGAASSGKTALALNILNNTSKAGVKSVFASLDMHKNRMFEKVMYKIGGQSREELYETFKANKESDLINKLKEEFGNVYFFNKSCPSVKDVKDYIISCQDHCGEKIKFVMLDYFERITSELSDDTASSKRVAGELQDLVNDLDVALITLVQPNKFALSSGPDTPIYDYTKIKGSSYLYQSFRIILSIWRPFFNPQSFDKDRYLQMALLKNDLGELREFQFNWDGPTGNITSMSDEQRREFKLEIDAKNNVKVQEEKDRTGMNFSTHIY